MRKITTVVIGAGHAGLAMSRCLAERSIDHVVLERGEVANSWRTERWDSLRLLTPNWQSRLPGYGYEGTIPTASARCPRSSPSSSATRGLIAAPVRDRTPVTSVRRPTAATRSRPTAATGSARRRGAGQRRLQPAVRPEARRGVPPAIRTLTPHAVPQSGPARARAACWSSAPRRRASRSPTRSTAPAAR